MKHRYVGLHASAHGWVLGEHLKKHSKLVVLCKDKQVAEDTAKDLQFFAGAVPIFQFNPWGTLPFEEVSPDVDVTADRIRVLSLVQRLENFVVFTTPDALIQRIIPRDQLLALGFNLTVGDTLPREELLQKLETAGYSRVPLVEHIGEYTMRGGVFDIFNQTNASPIRIRFDDTKISAIQKFDPENQRSDEDLQTVEILPVLEILPNLPTQPIKDRGKILETPPREIVRVINAFKTNLHIPGIELFQFLSLSATETLLDYLPPGSCLVVQDQLGTTQSIDETFAQIEDRYKRLSSEHHLIPSLESMYLSPKELNESYISKSSLYLDQVEMLHDEIKNKRIRSFSNTELKTQLKTKVGSGAALSPLKAQLNDWRKNNFSIAFVVGTNSRAERLQRMLLAIDIDAPLSYLSGTEWLENRARVPVSILLGYLSQGVQLPDEKVVFISEAEIFTERSYRRPKKSKQSLKKLLNSLSQLTEGDFVVHTDYGVGVYKGLKHIVVDQSEGDFLYIEYADSTLYVPVQNIGKVQKFAAAEGQTPTIDKLSSTKWVKTKQKVRESVVQLAGDLIRLYAARSVAKGWRFDTVGSEDERFAETFPYTETADQLTAIEDTLSDMAKDSIMDRLVCGDVGFGKTEVAIRAAFKCIQHRRQVALLVPTTILVDQHRRSFEARFQEYDVKIAALSRFNTPKQNKDIIEKLKTGDIDIVIGTHRLLSRDVTFNDLGLIIIDEEHRFGVKQKERLKAIKKSVDVLTLTATPIPRTLHMALLGIRDVSVISTPPTDRRIIRTYVAHHDGAIIRDAILRELQRGGQVFYLHNRIESIDMVTGELANLIPEAKLRFAHGQMSEHQLEQIMEEFIDHKFDVLVSTTIIESGIDIPNANTIIVDRADTFGLAQLYQIRGRVGRSTRQAYAYLLIPKARKLGAEAQQRLKALQGLDDLGMGFQLAMRDLEIRGVGNLLGKEQSGNVIAVGFELYTKIVKEAVLNLKGEELDLSETIDPEVKIGVPAFIPDWYIPDVSERLIMYQRLSTISNDDETNDLKVEMEDRFGPLSVEVRSLVELMRYRALLRKFGVAKAEFINSSIVISLSSRSPVDVEKILALCAKHPDEIRFGKNLTLTVKMARETIHDASDLYPVTAELLEKVSA